jgi:hypothetical protein
VLLEIDTAATSSTANVLLPGEGILFPDGVWYTAVSTAPVGVTVVYG